MMRRGLAKFFARLRSRHGQTLVLGVLAILILVLAIIFLFDLQSMIRVKVRAQTATDAAALAGSNWQKHSLNLIGELNIVKACTVLVSDIEPFGDDSPEAISYSSELLTEMQSRISFVGPLIGVGAAQQAAKNNRIDDCGWNAMSRRASDLLDQLTYGVSDYYTDASSEIENYYWQMPYYLMLSSLSEEVLQGGFAVEPSGVFAGQPSVDPFWLADEDLYDQIAANYWCGQPLRGVLKYFNFDGQWWQVDISEDSSNFPRESEYLTLGVEYSGAGAMFMTEETESALGTLAEERNLTLYDSYDTDDPEDTDGINSPLPYVNWCIFDSGWDYTPLSEWTDGTWLRGEFNTAYIYGGAISGMRTFPEQPSLLSGFYQVNSLQSENVIESNQAAKDYYESSLSIESVSAAKPFGMLADGIAPFEANMVLPVFDRSRMIPFSMFPIDFDPLGDTLVEFLKWLAEVDDLDNPGSSPPAGTEYYLYCLQKLNDPEWRALGYNRDYVDTGYPTSPYDAGSNPQGAGWLQMGYMYSYDEEGEPTGIVMTNEDTCNRWRNGGGGGPRSGPSMLH